MIVVKDVPNQLGNRLFAFSSVIAFAAEKDIRVYSRSFDDYKKFFPLIASDDFLGYKISTRFSRFEPIDFIAKKIIRLFTKLLRVISLPFFTFIKNNKNLSLSWLEKKSRNGFVFVDSWAFPVSEEIFSNRTDLIKQLFTPDKARMDNIERLVQSQRKNSSHVIIGVHRRLGDYASFLNGIYFFPDAIYVEKMKMLKEELENSGKSVSFLISTNEKIDPNNFKGLDYSSCSGDFIEDMYALSKCDYVFGPPSTFSQWASFYGNVPLYLFKNKDEVFSVKGFSPIYFQDKFQNGRSFSHL